MDGDTLSVNVTYGKSSVEYSESPWKSLFYSIIYAMCFFRRVCKKDVTSFIGKLVYSSPLDLRSTVVLHVSDTTSFYNIMTKDSQMRLRWIDEKTRWYYPTCPICLRPQAFENETICLRKHYIYDKRGVECLFKTVVLKGDIITNTWSINVALASLMKKLIGYFIAFPFRWLFFLVVNHFVLFLHFPRAWKRWWFAPILDSRRVIH